MSIYDVILTRRTIYQFKEQPVKYELITHCLQAAVWAPNHGLTQPWRFWILGKQTQSKLAEIHAEKRASKRYQPLTAEFSQAYECAKQRILDIPLIILVGQMLADDPTTRKEDYAACACAIQNFQLAAWEQGLATQWSSAPMISSAQTYSLLTINPTEIELINALFCGYPAIQTEPQPRQSLERVCQFTD